MADQLHGRLEERALGQVFAELAKLRETGILTVQSYPDMLSVSFADGEVVSADTVDQPGDEGLGGVLDAMGLVKPEDYANLLAEQESGGGVVLDLLVERSYVTHEQLSEALRSHVYGVCRLVLGWRDGEYRFYSGEEVSYPEGMEPLGVEEILVRASADLGEAAPLDGEVPSAENVFVRAVDIQEGTKAGVSSEAERLFELIDGRRTAAQLAAAAELSQYKVLYLLHRWERFGWVDLLEEDEEPALVEEVAPFQEAPLLRQEEEELPPEEPPPRVTQPRVLPREVPWPARILGLGLLLAALVSLSASPERFLMPFDWQADLLHELRREQREASRLKLEHAAETFFLLYGHFPEELSRLAELRLIDPSDLTDPEGGSLEYSATAVSYGLQELTADGSPSGRGRTVTITGDFLLDPDFVVTPSSGEPALVLLD